MKRNLLSILLAIILIIGIMPSPVLVRASDTNSSQAGDYGDFIDGQQVISDMNKKNGKNVHPRIIMTEEKFEKLKSHIGDESVTAIMLKKLRNEADNILDMSVSEYEIPDGIRLLETSKRIQRRVATLAMAYNIFDEEKYAERCYKELEAACKFKDWNPRHFLDTAEMSTAFAFGYDWLYNWMTSEQRLYIRTNMIEKGLNQVMEDYTNTPSNRQRTYKWYQDQEGDNWQLVCTGGMNLMALAIGDEDDAKDIASEVIDYGYKRAYSFVRRAYNTVDGTYMEGLGYWDYATYYLGLQASALISATGTDYGLADYEGVRMSADFIRYMSSNTPKSFSFGDDGDSRDTGWAVFQWLAGYFDSPDIAAVRLKKIPNTSFNYLDALWIDEDRKSDSSVNNSTDWGSVGASNASFRTSWDEAGLVAALHVGENNYFYHGHYDLGSFYIESNGSRFFTDLGNEDYELFNRQFSYRIKPEGHNTIVINPTEGTDQLEGANCLITEYSGGNEAYAVTDLTEAYAPNGANKVVRGLKMIKDKNCVVIQDEIVLDKPGDIYWFAHTTGLIDVATDGRSAIVTVGDDRLWVGLISDASKFTVMKAEPLSTSMKVSGTTSNSDYRKLAIHLTNTKDTTISVACIPLKNGEKSPSWTPTMKTISKWSQVSEEKHDFSKYVSNGNGTHKVVCKDCGEVQKGHDKDSCSGGNATCKVKAKCSKCNAEYGSLAAHKQGTAVKENVVEATYKTPSSYDSVVYCTVCKKEISRKKITGEKLKQEDAPNVSVSYRTHVQTYGWQNFVKDGTTSGTYGQSKRLEGINIKVDGNDNLGIIYTTHCQTYGWLPWSANGDMSGTEGESKRLEAIEIKLTGVDKDKYDIYYRVHAQSYGWLAWAKNGEPAGTAGYAKRLEGIQIVVVKKGETVPNLPLEGVVYSGGKAFYAKEGKSPIVNYPSTSNTNPVIPGENLSTVAYRTHVQSIGWQGWKFNGQMSGTSGESKRLEGIEIKLNNKQYSGGITYRTHVQSYGWQAWKSDGDMSGTSGESKRLEAIEIKLTGDMAKQYDVYYRVHAQSYGWLAWAKNGASAGTAGYGKRLEGIQIVLVKKGDSAPGNTYMDISSTNSKAFIEK